jgi:hypothetical protein
VNRPSLPAIFGLPAIACAIWTLFAGKDVNWDLLHYHYYLPYQLLGGRIEQDFFAASSQSYLNPVGYLPFYLMVSGGLHSVVTSVLLAAAHSTSIGLVFLLSWNLFADRSRRERLQFSLLATALGAATAVYWMTVGASFLDPLLVPPMLAGLLLLLQGGEQSLRRAACAGALFGVAAALKYSNAIFVVAALPLALASPAGGRLRNALSYAAGAAIAIAVFAGPWLYLMMREFGNPVFPVMNAWFRAPEGLPINLVSERFTPKDLAAAAAFPFHVAMLDRSLYSENFAPDLRFAALAAVALGLAARSLTRRAADDTGGLSGDDWRLFAFLAFGYVLWLLTSANGRYGMVLLLLIGICVARLAERLLTVAIARTALAVLLLVQIVATALASPPRWFIAEPWSRSWLPFEVPARARSEPALYVSLEVLSMSAVAPFLHPDSSFVNFRGQYSLRPDSPRLAGLLEKYRGRVRTLARDMELSDGRPATDLVKAYDATLVRIGYRVDAEDCYTIRWSPEEDGLLSRAANRLAGELPAHEPVSVVSCGLLPAKQDPAAAQEERRFSALFDRIEQSCARLFRGQTAVTEPLGSGWSRNYGGLDARLEALGGRIALNRHRKATYVDLGLASDWERGVVASACWQG